MDIDIEKIRSTRHKCFSMTQEKLLEWVNEYKVESEADTTGVKELEYYLVTYIVHEAIYLNADFRKIEDIYARIISDEWKQEDPTFPDVLKLEFLHVMHLMSEDLGHLDRALNIRSLIKTFVENNPDDLNAAYIYIHVLYDVMIETLMQKSLEINDYLESIDSIIQKHKFSKSQLEGFELSKNKMLTDYYSMVNPSKGFFHIDEMIRIASIDKKIYNINLIMDQLMSYGLRYTDEFESYIGV